VKNFISDDEGGNGFDSGLRGFGYPIFGGTQMDDLQIDLGPIQIGCDGILGFDTDRATSVIELGGCFHIVLFGFYRLLFIGYFYV